MSLLSQWTCRVWPCSSVGRAVWYTLSMENIEYQDKLYKERLSFAIDYLGSVCVRCNGVVDLEFDHIDPKLKNATVTTILKGNKSKLIKELNLCQLLCNSCHKKKTSKSRIPWQHGTIHGYQNKQCRCNECKEAQRVYKAACTGNKPKEPRRCGSYAMYKSGCRCDDCKRANKDYMRALRNKG